MTIRRDLNDLIRDPGGRVAEAKVWANIGKCSIVYLLLQHAESVLKDWAILTALVTALIAPDLFKKVLSLRAGGTDERNKP